VTISMYDVSVPVFLRCLDNVSAVLDKGIQDATARNINIDVFAKSRLYPDMFCLTEQILFMTVNAAGGGARLAGKEPPPLVWDDGTYVGAQERVKKTADFLRSLKREDIDGSEDRPVSFVNFAKKQMNFKGQQFLLEFATPNVFFHYSMTYAILRENGVVLGKTDFLG
jgi:uncharacterized protein